jgi:hypothetical protein
VAKKFNWGVLGQGFCYIGATICVPISRPSFSCQVLEFSEYLFPTLLTLLGNVWFWNVMLLTRQYHISACCWLAADHYRRAGGERCWQDSTLWRGHVQRDLGKYGMYFQVFMKRVSGRKEGTQIQCVVQTFMSFYDIF